MAVNANKLATIIDHLQQGGATDKESLCNCIGATVKTRDSTIQAYLTAAGEKDEFLSDLAIGGENPYADEDEPNQEEEPEEELEEEAEEEVEEEEPEEEPAPKPKKPSKSKAKSKTKDDFRFFLDNGDGTSHEIRQVGKSGKFITFELLPTEDLVTLTVSGNTVEVDLIALAAEPKDAMSEYGISNESLLSLATLAK